MTPYQAHDLLIEEIKSKNPDFELIKGILEYSVIDVNSKDSKGQTALMWAAEWGKEKPVELLLNHPGINVNLQGKWRCTALMRAVAEGREKCVELLLNHPGINVNLRNENDKTALMLAMGLRAKEKVVELLLNHPGIDVKARNLYKGDTAWSLATDSIRQKFPKLNPNS
jgi:ankyrin repeat protein